MDIFIVYAHPSSKSYTYRILETLVNTLKTAGHQIEISDLYKMNFRSDMTTEEYEREGSASVEISLPEDVVKEHVKIERADCIIFLYPLWWSDCPAKLKGWFDRVYTVGYAYGYNANAEKVRRMKTIKYGLAITTCGHSNDLLEENGLAESMRKIMLDDRMGDRFENKKMMLLGGTLDIEREGKHHMKIVTQLAKDMDKYFQT